MATSAFPFKIVTSSTGKQSLDPAFAQCVSDSLTHYNYMKDPTRTFVHDGNGSLFGGSVSGSTDAVRFFASGDLDICVPILERAARTETK